MEHTYDRDLTNLTSFCLKINLVLFPQPNFLGICNVEIKASNTPRQSGHKETPTIEKISLQKVFVFMSEVNEFYQYSVFTMNNCYYPSISTSIKYIFYKIRSIYIVLLQLISFTLILGTKTFKLL